MLQVGVVFYVIWTIEQHFSACRTFLLLQHTGPSVNFWSWKNNRWCVPTNVECFEGKFIWIWENRVAGLSLSMSGELNPDLRSFNQAKLGSLGRLTSDSKSSSVLLIRALQLDDFTQAMTQVHRRRKWMILHQIRLHLFKIFELQWLKNSSKLATEILCRKLACCEFWWLWGVWYM